jgi:exopolysaccharide biosynthesis polyprenyl glycosylphosphotransferase
VSRTLETTGLKIHTTAAVQTSIDEARKIWLEGLAPDWFVFARGFQKSGYWLAFKRTSDIVLSLLFLVLVAPIAAVAAIAIRLESAGPVIFKQDRVGLGGRTFTVFKFRSMRMDAEKDGPVWAQVYDDRVTRVGRFIRRMRIDELPQILNVLKGDMSFVGPRPERPYFVDLLKKEIRFYDLRHQIKPGITGWAQVMYPYGASVEDSYQKLQFDLYYARNASLSLDLLILLKTVKVVLGAGGR